MVNVYGDVGRVFVHVTVYMGVRVYKNSWNKTQTRRSGAPARGVQAPSGPTTMRAHTYIYTLYTHIIITKHRHAIHIHTNTHLLVLLELVLPGARYPVLRHDDGRVVVPLPFVCVVFIFFGGGDCVVRWSVEKN